MLRKLKEASWELADIGAQEAGAAPQDAPKHGEGPQHDGKLVSLAHELIKNGKVHRIEEELKVKDRDRFMMIRMARGNSTRNSRLCWLESEALLGLL